MTARADANRDRRQRFAAPGGAHDRLIAALGKLLPAAIGLIAAVMVLAPLSPRGEVSFLLDRKKATVTNDRIDVERAMYRGLDDNGRLFQVTAGRAVQAAPTVPVIAMQNLSAQMKLDDGPATVDAPIGSYNFTTDKVSSQHPLTFTAADGYRMTMSNVTIDMNSRIANGAGGIVGTVPAGSFQSDQIVADLGRRTVALVGHARMRMVPGKMSVPQ